MRWLKDYAGDRLRVTDERVAHVETEHPEMRGQLRAIRDTLREPLCVVRSRTDSAVALYYRRYEESPVGDKFLCVVTRTGRSDRFIVTAFFTDTIKKGDRLWPRK